MRYILTKELGKLSRWLRLLGHDARYFHGTETSVFIIEAVREKRRIITKSRKVSGTLSNCTVRLSTGSVGEQLKELIAQKALTVDEKMLFTRCVVCNCLLTETTKEKIKEKVPSRVLRAHEKFTMCSDCGRVYWEGTHWGNIKEVIRKIKN